MLAVTKNITPSMIEALGKEIGEEWVVKRGTRKATEAMVVRHPELKIGQEIPVYVLYEKITPQTIIDSKGRKTEIKIRTRYSAATLEDLYDWARKVVTFPRKQKLRFVAGIIAPFTGFLFGLGWSMYQCRRAR